MSGDDWGECEECGQRPATTGIAFGSLGENVCQQCADGLTSDGAGVGNDIQQRSPEARYPPPFGKEEDCICPDSWRKTRPRNHSQRCQKAYERKRLIKALEYQANCGVQWAREALEEIERLSKLRRQGLAMKRRGTNGQ